MKKINPIVVFLLILSIGLIGCNPKKEQNNHEGLQVVATFYPMYDFAQNVLGDEGEVTLLIPAGTESHDYEPSAKDITHILDADVFIYNSAALETWVPSVLKNIDETKTIVVDASKGIDFLEETQEEHEEHSHSNHSHEYDPHIWLDPVLAQKEVDNIQEGLTQADDANGAIYEKNATNYKEKLAQLNKQYEVAFKNAKRRTFVTQHAAFSYLARRYDLEQVAIAGISSDQEPSPARLAELSAFVKEHDIQVIYFEELASPKIAETLARETGVALSILNPIEGITIEDQEQGMDYISTMEQNLKALQKSID